MSVAQQLARMQGGSGVSFQHSPAVAASSKPNPVPAHRESVRQWLRSQYEVEPSPFAVRAAQLLAYVYGGMHHVPHQRKTDWTRPSFIEVVIRRGLDTFDAPDMTYLVFLAHALCIRAEVVGAANGYARICLSRRTSRTGDVFNRHPTLEEAVAKFRAWFPAEWDEATSGEPALDAARRAE